MPTSSISQQLTVSPTPTTQSDHIENSVTSTSTIIETNSPQTFCPEMERGYEGSPMARLISQYRAFSDDDISTQQRAANFASKKTLLPNEIVELNGKQKSYSLLPSLLKDVTQVVDELQIFLERASTLIPE